MRTTMKIALFGVAGALALTGCSAPSTASDEIAVHKGSGWTEGKEDKGCVEPATRQLFWGQGMGDDYFYYPTNQRVFDFTKAGQGDADPFTVVSKDGQTLTVPGTLSFYLNANCDAVTEFHDKIGNRYQAYLEDGQDSAGWVKVLNIYMAPSVDATLDRIAKKYTWKELYADVAIKDEMNRVMNTEVARLINQQFLGDTEFFQNFEALIQQPIADPDLVAAVKQEETSKAQALATETKAKADAAAAEAAASAQVAQKTAELKVAQLERQIKQQEIQAFGGPENYINWLAVEQGINPFQPVYGSALVNVPQ
jgi:regulator of protease activity HflC (stomatin/prohibitin superfamily)